MSSLIMKAFDLSSCIMFWPVGCCLLEDSPFIKGNGREGYLETREGGGKLGGIGGEETEAGMYSMRDESIFMSKIFE